MVAHQGSSTPLKLKMRLVYYLQLQDRIDESLKVFAAIEGQLQKDA